MRKKVNAVLPPTDLVGAEKEMAIYAESDAKIEQINSSMDEQFAKIRETNAKELQELTEKRDQAFEKLHLFGESHRDELFVKKKSFGMSQGSIGYRTGTPKLKTQKGFTWAAVLKLLKGDTTGKDYVQSVEQPMKAKIIADRENPAVKVMMEDNGIDLVQDETFFIDLKKEDQE